MNAYITRFLSELTGSETGPLQNTRFSVKDVFNVVGFPTTAGIKPPLIAHATETASIITTLLKGGARLVGKTNLDPLCADGKGVNEFYGDIVHPVFSDATCLGSSGGAAASIIEDKLDFALGTDSGGSTRAPAASCELYGLRPRTASIPTHGIITTDLLLDSVGILTQTREALKKVGEYLGLNLGRVKIRTVYTPDAESLEGCSEVVRGSFVGFIADINGVEKSEWKQSPLFKSTADLRKPLMAHYVYSLMDTVGIALPDRVKALQVLGASQSPDIVEKCRQEIRDLRRSLDEIFPKESVILTPTLSSVHHDRNSKVPLNFFLGLVNVLDCASLTVPTERGPIQIIGRTEREVFSALEQLF